MLYYSIYWFLIKAFPHIIVNIPLFQLKTFCKCCVEHEKSTIKVPMDCSGAPDNKPDYEAEVKIFVFVMDRNVAWSAHHFWFIIWAFTYIWFLFNLCTYLNFRWTICCTIVSKLLHGFAQCPSGVLDGYLLLCMGNCPHQC